MPSQSDLVDQSPLLTPLSILPKSELHQPSASVSRFDTNLSNALNSVAERLPRTQTHNSLEGVTSAKLNEGFKNFTRNLRRDFSLRGLGRDKESRDQSVPRDSSEKGA